MSLVFLSQGQSMAVVVSLVTNLNGRLNVKCHRLLTLEGEKEGGEGSKSNSLSLSLLHTDIYIHAVQMYTYTPPTKVS